MVDREKVIKGLECCTMECTYEHPFRCKGCPYSQDDAPCEALPVKRDAIALLKENEKEIKALRLLVEWAEECDFGFDQFPIEYERYKDEIKSMKYTDGMIHIAKRTLENHGAFEKGM